ncbi:hypothetical protein DOY81_006586, partial [Sarcophaga bullata]
KFLYLIYYYISTKEKMSSNKNYNSAKFVPTRFSCPLFMVSRNSLKYTRCKDLEKYIAKNVNLYDNDREKEFEATTLKHFQNILGIEEYCTASKLTPRLEFKAIVSRDREKSWQLPPNRYDILKIPFIHSRGLGGAFWQKEHTHQSRPRPNVRQPQFRFYDLPKATEKMSGPCHRANGIFLSNARDQRPTSRCMVSNIGTCYKDPTEPGPTTYTPAHEERGVYKSTKKLNPHLFYRLSSVPVKKNSIYGQHISFTAAPGRYEVRYVRVCPCSSKFIYQPGIDLLIENEKRKKFRRLPYEKIKRKLYASPDLRHIKGKGFTHLFKGVKPIAKVIASTEQEVKKKNLKLYPDAKYITMITKPIRTPLSVRKEPLIDLPPRIKYNCIAKRITRKQLRSNKKIAFNSGQERFRDSYHLPILTQTQQDLIKQSLPLERQFRDHPIMNKSPSEIQTKIFFTPKHMLPHFVPKLRKKLFKFLPLPQAKVLVTEDDTNVKDTDTSGYYLNQIDPKNFFKDVVTQN